jgi:DNA-binding transcriptional ArsR family regulator
MVGEAAAGVAVTEALKALGDPVRWNIFIRIAAEPEVGNADLVVVAAVSKPTMSYHLRVLREAGLIQIRKSGRQHYYRVRREHGVRLVESARAQLAEFGRPAPRIAVS